MRTNYLCMGAGLIVLAQAKQCFNVTVPVEISARNGVFNIPEITSPLDATSLIQSFTSIANGANYTQETLVDYQTITGSFNISARFCQPDTLSGSKPVVQVLSHGIGFDKTYWDLPYNNFNYSYIDVAVDEYGYCTLSYDRFGIGNSSHADPYTEVQAPAELSALYQLNTMLRTGTFPGVDQAFNETGTIVNVGHSYGSQQSYALALAYPNVTDALILTGFSVNGSALTPFVTGLNTKIARLNQPLRFGKLNAAAIVENLLRLSQMVGGSTASIDGLLPSLFGNNITAEEALQIGRSTETLDIIAGFNLTPAPLPQDLSNGYLTWSDAQANQLNFVYPPGIDEEIIYYSEQNKQPFTVGELMTLQVAPVESPFTGPVQVVTGRQDAIFCSGDCLATGDPALPNIPAGVAKYLPQSSNFTTYIPEATGHGINLHYDAVMTYREIQDFLEANGIAPS